MFIKTGILYDTASFAEKEWKILAICLVLILVMSVLRKSAGLKLVRDGSHSQKKTAWLCPKLETLKYVQAMSDKLRLS